MPDPPSLKLRRAKGEMQEWLNWHAWKACVPQKGTGGSNPPLSATPDYSRPANRRVGSFLFQKARRCSHRQGLMKNKNPICLANWE